MQFISPFHINWLTQYTRQYCFEWNDEVREWARERQIRYVAAAISQLEETLLLISNTKRTFLRIEWERTRCDDAKRKHNFTVWCDKCQCYNRNATTASVVVRNTHRLISIANVLFQTSIAKRLRCFNRHSEMHSFMSFWTCVMLVFWVVGAAAAVVVVVVVFIVISFGMRISNWFIGSLRVTIQQIYNYKQHIDVKYL